MCADNAASSRHAACLEAQMHSARRAVDTSSERMERWQQPEGGLGRTTGPAWFLAGTTEVVHIGQVNPAGAWSTNVVIQHRIVRRMSAQDWQDISRPPGDAEQHHGRGD